MAVSRSFTVMGSLIPSHPPEAATKLSPADHTPKPEPDQPKSGLLVAFGARAGYYNGAQGGGALADGGRLASAAWARTALSDAAFAHWPVGLVDRVESDPLRTSACGRCARGGRFAA